MSDKDLTPAQRSLLLILMAEGQEIPNTLLTNHYSFALAKDKREDLERRKFISTRTENRRLYWTLDDKGWEWCSRQFTESVPKGSGHGSAAAYALLGSVLRFTQANRADLSEFFVRIESVASEDDVETQIRKAYNQVAAAPGEEVRLAELRSMLGGLSRSDLDETLTAMSRQSTVHVYPESRQSTLTGADEAAAIRIGNQANHLIVID